MKRKEKKRKEKKRKEKKSKEKKRKEKKRKEKKRKEKKRKEKKRKDMIFYMSTVSGAVPRIYLYDPARKIRPLRPSSSNGLFSRGRAQNRRRKAKTVHNRKA